MNGGRRETRTTKDIIKDALLEPGIITCQRVITWNKNRAEEYRKHHRKWKESL